MANTKSTTNSKSSSCQKIQDAARKVTVSSRTASSFLKAAGIMTPKGNLSPKYR